MTGANYNMADAQTRETHVTPHLKQASPYEGSVTSLPFNRATTRQKTQKKRAWQLCGVALGILMGIYFLGVLVFSHFFLPNTVLAGEDVSFKEINSVIKSANAHIASYATTICGNGIHIAVSADDVELAIDVNDRIGGIIAETHAWEWPIEIFKRHVQSKPLLVSCNTAKLSAMLDPVVSYINTQAKQPKNATAVWDDAAGRFVIASEVLGTVIDRNALTEMVSKALRRLQKPIIVGDESLVKPSKTKDDAALNAAVQKANAIAETQLSLTFKDAEIKPITNALSKDWIVFKDDSTAAVDDNKVSVWIKNNLAKQFNTVGTERTFTRPDGKKCCVKGGTYGWSLNSVALVELIVSHLTSSTSGSLEIPVKTTAATYPKSGGADWGKRYVDVDISEQHVRVYDENGNPIWESDCVSGNPNQDRATPLGVYTIRTKSRNVTLIGEPDPQTRKPIYRVPVNHWMPFIGNSVGLHDAAWRRTFGGTYYQSSGSHGCINLPADAASKLYDLLHVGDVVVSHA